jgi:hypothetical protein
MLRLRAFRPTPDKVVRLLLHPTYPWLVTADASDNVVVWDWEHRQVIYEVNVRGIDERRNVGAQLQKLAEGEAGMGISILLIFLLSSSYLSGFVLHPRLNEFFCC